MEFSEIKPGLGSYGKELIAERQAVKTAFARIADSLKNMNAIESKYADLKIKISEVAGTANGALFTEELGIYEQERDGFISTLNQLDDAVTAAGLMLI